MQALAEEKASCQAELDSLSNQYEQSEWVQIQVWEIHKGQSILLYTLRPFWRLAPNSNWYLSLQLQVAQMSA